jgi:AcrR family transcriptional regulator
MSRPSPKPAGSRRSLDRETVLVEAREMVIALGHEALSLRPLAARLGVTAAALYAYVDDKHDLLRSVALNEYDHLADQYAAFESNNPIDLLHQISRLYVLNADENPELFRVMFMFPPLLDPHSEDDASKGRRSYDIARDAVADAMSQGLMRPGNIEKTSLSIWAAVHGVAVFTMARSDLGADFRRSMLDLVFNNLMAGLAKDRTSIEETGG